MGELTKECVLNSTLEEFKEHVEIKGEYVSSGNEYDSILHHCVFTLLGNTGSEESENYRKLVWVLERGVELEEEGFLGRSPLFYALLQGKAFLVETLLKFGADMNMIKMNTSVWQNVFEPIFFERDDSEKIKQTKECFLCLLGHGVDVNLKTIYQGNIEDIFYYINLVSIKRELYNMLRPYKHRFSEENQKKYATLRMQDLF